MEPVDVVGFEGRWSPAAPDPAEVRVVPLPPGRQQEAVDLVCARLPHSTRGEAGWHFDAPEVFDGLASVEAVDRHGSMLGVGFTGHPHFAPEGRAFQRVIVAHANEGRGVGHALRQALLDRVPEGTTSLFAGTFDDDPRSLEVARHWGFTVEEHAIESQLDLVDLPTPEPPVGVTLRDVPDLDFEDADAVERMLLSSQTNPEAALGWTMDLHRLRSLISENETPVGVLARVDGVPAAITFGGVSDGVLMIAYSGVEPAYRGRGLMTLVKQRAHLSAREAGARVSRTANEVNNHGIRRINAALGYVVQSGVHRMSQQLRP